MEGGSEFKREERRYSGERLVSEILGIGRWSRESERVERVGILKFIIERSSGQSEVEFKILYRNFKSVLSVRFWRLDKEREDNTASEDILRKCGTLCLTILAKK